MFVLGHLGVGSRMLFGVRRRLPAWPLYLGCLLPDLIDKPLFYGQHLLHRAPGLITGTRTFGHTGIFFLLLLAAAAVVRRPWAWALFAGVATHFALDIAGELLTGAEPGSSIWLAIFYPASRMFPVARFDTLGQHLWLSAQNWYLVAGEVAGALILLNELRLRQRSS